MVAAANPKRQNENEPSKESDNIEVSVEPFNPATSMKKRKTGNANLVKSAFEDTLNNFAEDDEQSSTCEWHYCIRSILQCEAPTNPRQCFFTVENSERAWARSPAPKLDPATDKLGTHTSRAGMWYSKSYY